MHLLYNGQLLPEAELRLPLTNRAFQYNDGFFETVMVQNGRLRFWPDHLDRMQEAARALQLELPQTMQSPQLEETLQVLLAQNKATTYGRLKLKVWRSGAGLYTPDTNTADWLATAQPATTPAPATLRVGLCQGLHTCFSPFSFFKGPNALLYVMAGIQKKNRGTDDLVLLTAAGHVAELIAANIFWIKGNTLYTPALETGCVNGIMRRNVLRWCSTKQGIAAEEVVAGAEHLFKADAVFAANVTGIRSIGQLEDTTFETDHPLVHWLIQQEAGT